MHGERVAVDPVLEEDDAGLTGYRGEEPAAGSGTLEAEPQHLVQRLGAGLHTAGDDDHATVPTRLLGSDRDVAIPPENGGPSGSRRGMAKINVTGISPDELAGIRERGIDQGGNPVEPFVDADGGWPLRCCLTDSTPGERIAIVAWSPFPWKSPYRELGPIVIHADDCPTPHDGSFPAQFEDHRQVLPSYGFDRRIAYDHLGHG